MRRSAVAACRLARPLACARAPYSAPAIARNAAFRRDSPCLSRAFNTAGQDPSKFRQDIDLSLLEIERIPNPGKVPDGKDLVFGRTFTDHMLSIPWTATSGWGVPKIHPYRPFTLDPSANVLHYASTLFEGLKAYRNKDGDVTMFRPDMNMKRMNTSASRLAFPAFSGEKLTELLKKLVDMDRDWIPTAPGHSLYIRPTMIGTQAGLGVGACGEVLLFVICSPVGPYYPTGFKPVSLLASTTHTRAWPGGTGGYKLGLNYAPGIVPQIDAAMEGHQQILWLYGDDHRLTEVGTMNLFIVIEENGVTELITPTLEDMVLPGVTRDSALQLAREHADPNSPTNISTLPPADKFKVSERNVTMPELKKLVAEGKVKEMFGTGTAAVVSPIKQIGYMGETIKIPVGADGLGTIARTMLTEIVGRQTGQISSNWAVPVPRAA